MSSISCYLCSASALLFCCCRCCPLFWLGLLHLIRLWLLAPSPVAPSHPPPHLCLPLPPLSPRLDVSGSSSITSDSPSNSDSSFPLFSLSSFLASLLPSSPPSPLPAFIRVSLVLLLLLLPSLASAALCTCYNPSTSLRLFVFHFALSSRWASGNESVAIVSAAAAAAAVQSGDVVECLLASAGS